MDRAQLGHRLVYSHAILQARHGAKKSSTLIGSASDRHRQDGPKLRGPARSRTLFNVKLKIRRHHTDDRECLTIESYWLANDTRLTTETTLPQSITEHCDWGLISLVVFGQECSTKNRIDTEYFEEFGRCKLD